MPREISYLQSHVDLERHHDLGAWRACWNVQPQPTNLHIRKTSHHHHFQINFRLSNQWQCQKPSKFNLHSVMTGFSAESNGVLRPENVVEVGREEGEKRRVRNTRRIIMKSINMLRINELNYFTQVVLCAFSNSIQ